MKANEKTLRPLRSLREYQHVVWDWNGTLLDDLWLCVDVMNSLLKPRGLEPLTLDRYRDLFDFPVIDYYRRLGFDFATESFEAVGTEFIQTYERRRHEATLQAGAAELLGRVHEAGVGQSILSAYRQPTLEEFVRHFGLSRLFDHLVGLDDHYAHSKEENGLDLIRKLDVDPDDVLMIGDSSHDFEVAEAMAIDCWLLDYGHHSRAKLAAHGVPVFSLLAELRF